ncbi:hypothetical protein L211DRAFT_413614 [Terfezia boudieri ATCC MYA-4762]|uniref:non-specific serine/threonine protein kinase n=1 Tax=Terfezia boudieri ATCC MYA-4762 TaxID=1051890 RepID=A0A3N4LGD8_9PEZI|nr:hypothetical protein L211DRAFT_413614 [Terfezia boudieri ATCC MYA-4762]
MAASAFGHVSSSMPGSNYVAPPIAPPGTFPPGTLITVGAHKCTIERYLSEGGFAHVYLVRLARAVNGSEVAVLKRVAVPDKDALANMRTEVETMKRLKGHRHIVTYIDSHASHLKGGGYEVFLLMEYCSGGGLIDFMNTRLQNRLTEPEVLSIISDIAEGVACMHYLQPPLLHRDLKVENVLIATSRRFVLCDFGSCSAVREPASSLAECRLLEEDIQKHTTLQYRSPEMVDVYRKLPIDEKSDIWALGVLLYKLCYYTTPFEEQGQLAILNASFKFPSYPLFSDRLKNLIASMLRESPFQRPNIYQVLRDICSMRGKEVPVKDIYKGGTAQAKLTDRPQHTVQMNPAPSVIAYQAPQAPQKTILPDIVPMRRGRPTKSPHSGVTASPQVRAISSDPFVALDNTTHASLPLQDELSARFPSVEQFSLLHDSGTKFDFKEFNPDSPTAFPPTAPTKDLSTRVMERLADDAFLQPPVTSEKKSPVEDTGRDLIESGQSGVRPALYQPQPQRPPMVSTGTMTSPTHSPSQSPDKLNMKVSEALSQPYSRPQSRSHERYVPSTTTATTTVTATNASQRPAYLEAYRSTSQTTPRHTVSSRPSLESYRPSSSMEIHGNGTRSKAPSSKIRPASVYIESNLDFLRDLDSPVKDKETTPPPTSGLLTPGHGMQQNFTGHSISSQRSDHIESNVDFLRAMENESDAAKGGSKADRRSTSGSFVGKHVKRASMPSISLSNTKTLLAGKFGEAFRRFEGNGNGEPNRTSSPPNDNYLGSITGSGPASEISNDEPWEITGTEGISSEARREMEKRMLVQEEERVAAAAAKYKKEVSSRAPADGFLQQSSSSRASSIQNKVKALLSENRAPTPRTAEGYGQYTDEAHYRSQQQQQQPQQDKLSLRPSTVAKSEKMTRGDSYGEYDRDGNRGSAARSSSELSQAVLKPRIRTSTEKLAKPNLANTSPTRPAPPPKPHKLRELDVAAITIKNKGDAVGGRRWRNPKSDEVSLDLQDEDFVGDPDEWQRNFNQRYPSLSGLEMVETVVGNGKKS